MSTNLQSAVLDCLSRAVPGGFTFADNTFSFASLGCFFRGGAALFADGFILERPAARAARLGVSRQAIQLAADRGQVLCLRLAASRLVFVLDRC